MTRPEVAAVVVAAGRGRRLGRHGDDRGKALVEVAGHSLVEHAVDGLSATGAIDVIVVVHPQGEGDAFAALLGDQVTLVTGGPTRSDSVRTGISALTTPVDLVAVHDAARAFVPVDVVRATLAAVEGDVIAAAPALRLVDTVKRVVGDGRVVATVDREHLRAAQTPQVIRYDVARALVEADRWGEATDDLGVVEAAVAAGVVDGTIRLVPGDRRGLKVTTPADLGVIRALTEGEG